MTTPHQSLTQLIADDSHAATFQTVGQYRQALLEHAGNIQGVPVALPERKNPSAYPLPMDAARGYGWNACLDAIAKLGPLYTRAAVQKSEPVMRLECEKLWGGDGEYAVDFVKPGWLQDCRAKGGTFLLYTHPAPAVQDGESVAEVTMIDPLILTTGNLHTLKVGDKLYTHADPGEVERLRKALSEAEDRLETHRQYDTQRHVELGMESMQVIGENTKLRAQLAERDALLRELDNAWNSHDGKDRFGKLMQKVEALSASAEPEVKP